MSATNSMQRLEDYTAWVLHKLATGKNGRQKKPPIHPVTRKYLSWSNPFNWLTHDEACRLHAQGIGDGISFIFSDAAPFYFVDLDDCFDKQGNLLPYARHIVDTIDSYTERSVSGKGLHIVAVGKKASIGCVFLFQGGKVEVYDRKRAMAYTGNVFESRSAVNDRQKELDRLLSTSTLGGKSHGSKASKKNPAEDRSSKADAFIKGLHKLGLPERSILAQLKKTEWWSHYTSDEHATADIRRIIRKINHVLPRNPNLQAEWNPAALSLSNEIAKKRAAFSSMYYAISAPQYDHLLSLYVAAGVKVPYFAGESVPT